MELTWKDKISYQVQELKTRFPFISSVKRNYLVMGGGIVGVIVISSTVFFLSQSHSVQTPRSNPIPNNNPPIAQSVISQPTTTSPVPSTNTQVQTALPVAQTTIQLSPTPTKSLQAPVSSVLPGDTQANNDSIIQVIGHSNNPNLQDNTTYLSGIKLYFPDQNGNLQQYIPPDNPPIAVTWSTYFNRQDNFSIDLPNGWQVVKVTSNGHEGISVFPPGMDTSLTLQTGLKEIGFGVLQTYEVPYIGNSQGAYNTPLTIDGYSGTIYTQGPYGSDTLAAIIKYGNVYFGIGATANTDDMIYIFQHMMGSLQLYGN